jgi:hypothetical protein
MISAGCIHKANISDYPDVCFNGEVLPVFLNNCAMTGCHDGFSGEEMSLTNYTEIARNVKPGNAEKSELYQVITDKWGQGMPPDRPLSIENRVKIRLWIEQGAKENTCNNLVVIPEYMSK